MGSGDDRGPDPGVWRDEDTAVAVESEKKVERPRRYRVVLLNDDYTTMEFVVMVLTNVFHRSRERAVEIMLHVHHEGAGVAGVYTLEVAETKVAKVAEIARQHEFPLRCTMEPE